MFLRSLLLSLPMICRSPEGIDGGNGGSEDAGDAGAEQVTEYGRDTFGIPNGTFARGGDGDGLAFKSDEGGDAGKGGKGKPAGGGEPKFINLSTGQKLNVSRMTASEIADVINEDHRVRQEQSARDRKAAAERRNEDRRAPARGGDGKFTAGEGADGNKGGQGDADPVKAAEAAYDKAWDAYHENPSKANADTMKTAHKAFLAAQREADRAEMQREFKSNQPLPKAAEVAAGFKGVPASVHSALESIAERILSGEMVDPDGEPIDPADLDFNDPAVRLAILQHAVAESANGGKISSAGSGTERPSDRGGRGGSGIQQQKPTPPRAAARPGGGERGGSSPGRDRSQPQRVTMADGARMAMSDGD